MEEIKFSNNEFKVLKEVENSRIETKNGKEVKVGKVKCPLCGENMRVSSLSFPSREDAFSLPRYEEDIGIGHMSSQGKMCEVFTWTCPCCRAELKAQVIRSFRNEATVYNLVPLT